MTEKAYQTRTDHFRHCPGTPEAEDWQQTQRDFQQEALHVGSTIDSAKALLEAGAWKVTIEAAAVSASRKGSAGEDGQRLIEVAGAVGVENLVFEGGDHRWLIKTFGPDINVGNAGDANQIWYLEMMRQGISPRMWHGELGVFEL